MTSSRARGGLTISTRAKNPQDNQSAQAPRATTSGTGAPAVVVVLVTHNPQETFETTLASLEAQDYANQAVLVFDNDSDEPVDGRVKAVLSDAHVVRLAANRGFGAAANRAPAVVKGASFYLFCHDDVYLEPNTVSALVAEAFRSNAGVVGPKFVDWDEPEMLLDVGRAIDKFAFPAPVTEPGELDQAQHDAVRDTFSVNGATMLVRADLFEAVDGFPSDFSAYEEDTDLCWRVHLAGARVIVTSDAVVRHREATLREVPAAERLRSQYAHRARMVLTNYSGAHLARVLPQAVLFSLGDLILNLLAFRWVRAADVALAWTWNVAHLPRSLAIRRQVKGFRRSPDTEIRKLQVGGSARVTAFVRGTVGEGAARFNTGAQQSRTVVQRLREGPSQVAALASVLIALVLIIGSRSVILGDIPIIREFSGTGTSWSSMLREYWDGWRTTGLGATAPTPTLVGLVGSLSTLLFGGEGLARNLLIVGCLPAGVTGAWWMARGGSSSKTRALMMVAYVITPVPYNAIAEGRWGALGLWAGLPWMVGLLGRSAGAMPFAGSEFPTLKGLRATVALGLVTAAVTTVLPLAPLLMVIVALLMAAVGTLDRSDLARWERAVPTAIGASAIAFVLHLPWAIGLLLPLPSWSEIVGPVSTAGGPVALRDLVWLDSGPNSFGLVLVGLHLAGAFAILVGREWRFRLATQGWAIALVGWVLAWMGEARIGPVLPPPEVTLMLPVIGLSLAIGAGLAAFERDVAGSDFGFRQVFSMVAATLMVVASVAWVARSANGRWGLPEEGNLAVVGTLTSQAPEGEYRTLWLGDADVLPMGSWTLSNGSSFATTSGLFPRIGDWFEGPSSKGTDTLKEALEDAVAGKTTRLGRLLGAMGIKYVVVAQSGAPLAYDKGKAVVKPPDSTVNALDEQLDLARLSVSKSVFIYDNSAFTPEVAELPSGALDKAGSDLAAILTTDLSGAKAALPERGRFADGSGELADDVELYVARTHDANWTLTVGDAEVEQRPAFGWASQASISSGGDARLVYSPPLVRNLAVIVQLLALVAAINIVSRRRTGVIKVGGLKRMLGDRRELVAERKLRREQEPEVDGPLLPTSELPTFTMEGEEVPYEPPESDWSFDDDEEPSLDSGAPAGLDEEAQPGFDADAKPDAARPAPVASDRDGPTTPDGPARPTPRDGDDEAAPEVRPEAAPAAPPETVTRETSEADRRATTEGDEDTGLADEPQLLDDKAEWDPGELEPEWMAEPPAVRRRRRRRRNVVLPGETETEAVVEPSGEEQPDVIPFGGGGSDAEGPGDEDAAVAGSEDHPAGSGRGRRQRPRLRLVRGRQDDEPDEPDADEPDAADERDADEPDAAQPAGGPAVSETGDTDEEAPPPVVRRRRSRRNGEEGRTPGEEREPTGDDPNEERP